jgi:GNAT superfamily N-acetyltransferase
MATTYRLCAPADLDRLAELLLGWLRADGRLADPGVVRRGLARLIGDTHLGHGWIIERDGIPAGYTVLSFSAHARSAAPRAYVTALYLRPECRGQGIGARTERFLREVGSWLRVPVHCFDTAHEAKHATVVLRPDTRRTPRSTDHLDQAVA